MADEKTRPDESTGLPTDAAGTRLLAEARVRADDLQVRTPLTPEEAQALTYELRVHQIQLEMQNEELRTTQEELEASRARYFDLYDLAPVGYFALDEQGLILEANLTAAGLLSVEMRALVGRPLHRFILPADQDIYYRHRRQLLEAGAPQACEMRMLREGGATFWARLEATVVQDDAGAPIYRVVLTDVTQRHGADETIAVLARFPSENPQPVLRVARDGTLLYANAAADPILRLWDVQPGARLPGALWQQVMDDLAASPTVEVDVVCDEGVFVLVYASVVEAGYVNVYGRDVTARRQAEAALQETARLHHDLVETTSDWVWEVDANAVYTYASPRVLSILGREPAEIVGKTPFDLMPPDEATRVAELFGAIVAKREAFSGLENTCLRADGRAVIVETSGVPIFDPLGAFRGYRGADKDITDRKRAEEELREAKALVDAVVENAPLMIFVKEATDLRFVIFNRAGEELLGYDRKDLLGRNNLDLFPPEQAAHFMAKDREVLDGKSGVVDIPEEPILTAEKGERLLHTRKVCIRGGDGTTKFLLGISEDITDRKRAELDAERTAAGLRAALAIAEETMMCPDVDAICLRTVELARERLGLERCSLYLLEGGRAKGTYGTNLQGETTDERDIQWELVPETLGQLPDNPDGTGWSVTEAPYSELVEGGFERDTGTGWIAATYVQSGETRAGVFYNDAAITGKPMDPSLGSDNHWNGNAR